MSELPDSVATSAATAAPAATPSEAGDHRPLTDVCFANFDLHPDLLRGLEAAGFVRCTPIQALTLPLTLEGKDVAGQAQTGTGKTLAFLVALFHRLLTKPAHADRKHTDPRAVVLAPTRELAIQIEKDARVLCRHLDLKLALIYGGVDYERQRETLRAGCDIVIATPGRLLDYYKQHVFTFNAVDAVVLDEADRMFDLGFIKDIRFILRRMPPREERQSCLFSATLSHRVLELAYEHMNDPTKLTVEADSVTADRVRQQVFFPATEEKLPLLIGLLSRMDCARTMVFVNTRAGVERVTRNLERAHFRVGALSGDVPQPKREKLLGKFTRGELEILVATDVAARGLHIPGVSHVFNYDLPGDAEDYVHRIGRTARLGAEGDAISFACDNYAMALPDIEAYIGMSLPRAVMDPELLLPVARKPLERTEISAEQAAAEAAADAADAARATKGPPKEKDREFVRRHGGPRHGGGGRDGRSGGGHGRGGHGGGRDGQRGQGGDGRHGQGQGHRHGPRPGASGEAAIAQDGIAPGTAVAGAEGAEFKKRRRRGGRGRRRHEEGAANAVAGQEAIPLTSAVTPPAAASAAPEPASLLSRIKQRIKGLVQRLPMPGRRR